MEKKIGWHEALRQYGAELASAAKAAEVEFLRASSEAQAAKKNLRQVKGPFFGFEERGWNTSSNEEVWREAEAARVAAVARGLEAAEARLRWAGIALERAMSAKVAADIAADVAATALQRAVWRGEE